MLAFLSDKEKALDPTLLRVYRSKLSGRERIGVIYGDFPSTAAAQEVLNSIRTSSGDRTPYIRSVTKLR